MKQRVFTGRSVALGLATGTVVSVALGAFVQGVWWGEGESPSGGTEETMSTEVIATVLTGAGVVLAVWRMVDNVRRELGNRIDAVNVRIDNILLADRKS